MADTLRLGRSAARHGGSSPSGSTTHGLGMNYYSDVSNILEEKTLCSYMVVVVSIK
jgi:hypothetical protein